jgi:hypothetical protein
VPSYLNITAEERSAFIESGASYFYTSGYCPDCEKDASAAQWSLTHYDDAQVIWNGHGLQPHLDEDAESLLH